MWGLVDQGQIPNVGLGFRVQDSGFRVVYNTGASGKVLSYTNNRRGS